MKNIWLYLLMSFWAIGVSSCKDEDDDIIAGNGGVLTGVWVAETSGDEETGEFGDGLLISKDGKIERIKVVGESYEYVSDYTEAIITDVISDKSLKLKGVRGNGTGDYELSETISVIDGKYASTPRLYFKSSIVQGTSGNDYYVKLKSLNPDMVTSEVERDSRIFGEWVQSFGDQTCTISTNSMIKNGVLMADWCTSGGKLYYLSSYGDMVFNSSSEYSISNGVLKIGNTEFVKKENAIKGNPGELAGLWVKTTSDLKYYQDGNMFGLMVDENGLVTNPRVSTTLTIDNSNIRNELIITSAKNGAFTAKSKTGANVTGKYKLDTVVVFMSSAYFKVEHLQITSSSYNFNLASGTNSATTFTGDYIHVLDKNGESCDVSAIDKDLVGDWKCTYDEGVEIFSFTESGILTISSQLINGSNRTLVFNWGSDLKGYSSHKLYLKNFNSTGEYVYEYFIYISDKNTFYFKDDDGVWWMYERQ